MDENQNPNQGQDQAKLNDLSAELNQLEQKPAQEPAATSPSQTPPPPPSESPVPEFQKVEDASPPATQPIVDTQPQTQQPSQVPQTPVSSPPPQPKPEKKGLFGKKKKDKTETPSVPQQPAAPAPKPKKDKKPLFGKKEKKADSVLPPAPPTKEPAEKKKSNPIIWIATGVLLLGLFGVGGYILVNRGTISLPGSATPTPASQLSNLPSPTPTATPGPTAGWLTHLDSEYGFKIMHPSDWETRDMLPANKSLAGFQNDVIFLGLAPISVKEDVLGSIRITTQSVATEVANATKVVEGTPTEVVSEGETTFLSYDATEVVTKNTQANVLGKAIVFAKGGMTYVLSWGGVTDATTVDLVFSTFEFVATESASPSPTASVSPSPTASPTPAN